MGADTKGLLPFRLIIKKYLIYSLFYPQLILLFL